jgi:hypothetical protein
MQQAEDHADVASSDRALAEQNLLNGIAIFRRCLLKTDARIAEIESDLDAIQRYVGVLSVNAGQAQERAIEPVARKVPEQEACGPTSGRVFRS